MRVVQAIPGSKPRRPLRFELLGGPVCLDFLNTLDDRPSAKPKELLASYADLVRFGEDSGILPKDQVGRLMAKSVVSPGAVQKTLGEAIHLREAMHKVFWAIVRRTPVAESDLFVLNGYIQEAAQHAKLAARGGRFAWEFDPLADSVYAPLWPITRSAADLLASDRLQFVRACASKTCQWLFLDESKNHQRRWCDMTKCGNRAKARSFYSRQKEQAR